MPFTDSQGQSPGELGVECRTQSFRVGKLGVPTFCETYELLKTESKNTCCKTKHVKVLRLLLLVWFHGLTDGFIDWLIDRASQLRGGRLPKTFWILYISSLQRCKMSAISSIFSMACSLMYLRNSKPLPFNELVFEPRIPSLKLT